MGKRRIHRKKYEYPYHIWAFLIFSVVTALLIAGERTLNGDFVAYNGDFQNYNVFRRVLSGQAQFRDFVNYLGSGFLIINLPLVALFHSFGESVFITNMTASLAYSLMLWIGIYSFTKSGKAASFFSSCIAAGAFFMLESNLIYRFPLIYKLFYNFFFFEKLGHSMRTTRAFLPFLLVGLYYLLVRLQLLKKEELFTKARCLFLSGILLGAFVIWSNDFGFACIGCFGIILLILDLLWYHLPVLTQLRNYFAYGLGSGLGAMISIGLITNGNVINYFRINAGIADYQFWYYGNTYGKLFTIFDILSDKRFLIYSIVFFAYSIRFVVDASTKGIGEKNVVLLFLQSTNYAAALIYVVGSGYHNYISLEFIIYLSLACDLFLWEVHTWKKYKSGSYKGRSNTVHVERFAARLNAHLTIWYEKATNWLQKHNVRTVLVSTWTIIMTLLYVGCIGVAARNYLRVDHSSSEYISGLKIHSVIGAGLDRVSDEIRGGTLFSTYASALEVLNGTFQPSDTDYIIHVLGNEQRERYTEKFLSTAWDYVSTLNNTYTTWEYWSSRVNWYLYRHLFTLYEPYDETNYSVIWKRSAESHIVNTPAELSAQHNEDNTYTIHLNLPEYNAPAYVDVAISYRVLWKNNRVRAGAISKALSVMDGGEQYNIYNANSCYYLSDVAECTYLPVFVNHGEGEIVLKSVPFGCTEIVDLNAEVVSVIRMPEYNLTVSNYTELQKKQVDPFTKNNTVLQFVNTEYAWSVLECADELESNGETLEIKSVHSSGDFIYVTAFASVDPANYAYPNKITAKANLGYTRLVDLTNAEWLNGINRDENELIFSNKIETSDLRALKCGNREQEIEEIILCEDYTLVRLRDGEGIQAFAYPQKIELIYGTSDKNSNVHTIVRTQLQDISDEEYIGGIRRDGPLLAVDKTIQADGLIAVRFGETEKAVIKTSSDNNCLLLWLEDGDEILEYAYPAEIELVYQKVEAK